MNEQPTNATIQQVVEILRREQTTKQPVTNFSPLLIESGKIIFRNIARTICPDFVIDDNNRDTVTKVFRYAMRIPTEGIDLNRGLWLEGNVGTGKTVLLKTYREFVNRTYYRPIGALNADKFRFNIFPCMSICFDFSSNGYDVLKSHAGRPAAYDDLGTEPATANYFGTPVNVFEYLLQIRYDRPDIRTHITTNLTPDDVAKRYGDRISDRCVEMFNRIELNGFSRRKSAKL